MPSPAATPTRDALVEEGVKALLELTPAQLLSAVGLKEVARRAGVAVTTLYHHFGNLDGFAEAVVARVYDPRVIPTGNNSEMIREITEGRFPFENAKTFHHFDFQRLAGDPEIRLRLGLWALGGPTVDGTYRDFLHRTEVPMIEATSRMIEAWDREPQPPFDIRSYVAAHVALVSGASVRHLVDPGVLDADRFARTGAALTTALTRPIGDPRTLDDRLAEINLYPLRAARSRPTSERRRATREQLLDAAAEVFTRDGETLATVPQVASHAGVSSSTAYSLFSGVDELAVALVARDAARSLAAGDASPGDPLAALLREISVIADFLVPRVRWLAPYGQRVLSGHLAADDAIVGRGRDALAAARDAGIVRAAVDPDRVAPVLVGVLVGAVLRRPSEGAEGAVEDVRVLLLPGVLTSHP